MFFSIDIGISSSKQDFKGRLSTSSTGADLGPSSVLLAPGTLTHHSPSNEVDFMGINMILL